MPASSYLLSCVSALLRLSLASCHFLRSSDFSTKSVVGTMRHFWVESTFWGTFVCLTRPDRYLFDHTFCESCWLHARRRRRRRKKTKASHLARIYLGDQRSWIEYIEEYCWLTAFIPPDRPASFAIESRPSLIFFFFVEPAFSIFSGSARTDLAQPQSIQPWQPPTHPLTWSITPRPSRPATRAPSP